MQIIDAHLHFHPDTYFDQIARHAMHENTEEHLQSEYERLGIKAGVVMGNRDLKDQGRYPDFLRYCVGLDSTYFRGEKADQAVELVEEHLKRENCVGLKLYPGYNPYYVYDAVYTPFYRLAERYGKPVAIHTGATASGNAYLKYSHPLTLDDVAVQFPRVQFIMCHFGNPWLVDAAAVLDKNKNVAADLSGILEGAAHMPDFLQENRDYVKLLESWIAYVADYSRFLFGTDWPLANLQGYIDFTKEIIPREHWEQVFFENANRIYQMRLSRSL